RFFRCHAWLSHVQTSLLIAYLTPATRVRGAMTFSPVTSSQPGVTFTDGDHATLVNPLHSYWSNGYTSNLSRSLNHV
ncbi:MAG: hypothetical protein AAB308_05500, partial [Nitrospirota bacterium]